MKSIGVSISLLIAILAAPPKAGGDPTIVQNLSEITFPAPVSAPVGECRVGTPSDVSRYEVFGAALGSKRGLHYATVLVSPAIVPKGSQEVIAFVRMDNRPPIYLLADTAHRLIFPDLADGEHKVEIGTFYLRDSGDLSQIGVGRYCFIEPNGGG